MTVGKSNKNAAPNRAMNCGSSPGADSGRELRRRAEEIVTVMGTDQDARLPEEARSLLHELRVHQIELKMQNEELRRSQEELEVSRARYFDLFDLAPVGYLTLSQEGVITEANLRAAELLGIQRSALVRQPLSRFIHPADQDTYYLHRRRLSETGEPQTCELRLLRPDGALLWVRLEAAAAREGEGGDPVCRATISDVTARKQAEEAKEGLQKQLLQTQKFELVGRLAGGVAHEFNNMLGVILMNTELATVQLNPSEPLRHHLQGIDAAAKRLANLTRQILGFARKQMRSPVELDLNGAVANMIATLRRLVGEDVQLEWAPGGELWSVRIDPTQIDQILANLVFNARDAVWGKGTITVETANAVLDAAFCAAHPGFAPGEFVRLAVRDTGTGMSRELLDHIFEPFFTTKEAGQGTGMGLATVFGIVKQNGGFIDVESEPGRGSTFRIYFRRCAAGVGVSVVPPPVALPAGGAETVLLVEDETALLNVGKQILKALGYQVLAAGSPEEALRLAAESGAIDLLITDLLMPGMGGRALARRLVAARPGLRCLFVSGYPNDMTADQGAGDQPAPFLQKPFSVQELARKVRETLDS